jgi:hypothetical protein
MTEIEEAKLDKQVTWIFHGLTAQTTENQDRLNKLVCTKSMKAFNAQVARWAFR